MNHGGGESEPQNALFQASFSLLKTLGSPYSGHHGPEHASHKSSAPCSILRALSTTPPTGTLEVLTARPNSYSSVLLLLGEPEKCMFSVTAPPKPVVTLTMDFVKAAVLHRSMVAA